MVWAGFSGLILLAVTVLIGTQEGSPPPYVEFAHRLVDLDVLVDAEPMTRVEFPFHVSARHPIKLARAWPDCSCIEVEILPKRDVWYPGDKGAVIASIPGSRYSSRQMDSNLWLEVEGVSDPPIQLEIRGQIYGDFHQEGEGIVFAGFASEPEGLSFTITKDSAENEGMWTYSRHDLKGKELELRLAKKSRRVSPLQGSTGLLNFVRQNFIFEISRSSCQELVPASTFLTLHFVRRDEVSQMEVKVDWDLKPDLIARPEIFYFGTVQMDMRSTRMIRIHHSAESPIELSSLSVDHPWMEIDLKESGEGRKLVYLHIVPRRKGHFSADLRIIGAREPPEMLDIPIRGNVK